MTPHSKTITATFTEEEHDLLEAFAAEQGIDDLSAAIPAMLHELVRLNDQIWDALLSQPSEVINEMGRKALDDYHAGLTEDLDL